jgi:hypothetical protein
MLTDMQDFDAVFPHLAVGDQANTLARNIGRRVRYRRPPGVERGRWIESVGTIASKEVYEIVGVQRIWNGALAYRVRCLAYDDTFGRPMGVEETLFLPEGGK